MSARWKRWAGGVFIALAVIAIAIFAVLESGWPEHWVRGEIVRQLDHRTGGRAEVGAFHLELWQLRAEIDNLTLHGLEAPGAQPLFHADRIDVGVRILSFFGRQIALDRLIIDEPQVAVQVDANGHSNLPTPNLHASKRPWRETLFQLRIGQLALNNGSASYNDRRAPLDVQGRDLIFTLRYDAPANAADSYVGNLTLQQMDVAARKYRPFRSDLSAKFTLRRDSFEMQELVWRGPQSELDLSAKLASFARPDWDLKYRGRLSMDDIRTIFRRPAAPEGVADFSGSAHYAGSAAGASAKSGAWTASGYFHAHDVQMAYEWFHARGMETSGDYEVANERVVVKNLSARALDGTVDGRLEMAFKKLAFRTETKVHGARLATILSAIHHKNFPVDQLHWDAAVEVDSVNTWEGPFKRFRTAGQMQWQPPANVAPGVIPVGAHFQYDYDTKTQSVVITNSQIQTPTAQIDVDGTLGAMDSGLEATFRGDELTDWDDFIAAIRGPDTPPHRISGKVLWTGRVLGPIVGPSFVGHLDATNASYDNLAWDQLNGDFDYSPDGFSMTKVVVRRGETAATLQFSLQFDGDWNFIDSSPWNLQASVQHAAGDDLQSLLGTNYPVTGTITGDLRGGGTRADPKLDARFAVANIEAKGWRFDSFTGQLHWEHGEVQLTNAEMRRETARVTGELTYRTGEGRSEFNITGTGIALEKIQQAQAAASLPIAGQLSFHMQGSGPIHALAGQADVRLTGLRLGTGDEGDFTGQIVSDGRTARLTLASAPATGRLQGELTVGLTGGEPISGKLSVSQFDLNPLIIAGLHARQLTGRSSADGVFTISGSLRQPDSIEVDADIARISFDYELVQLTNDQDIRLTYRRNEVRIDQAHLHGPDTDFQFSGSARFDRDRPLRFMLSGGVNLRLIRGLVPDLVAQGRADVNVSAEGTMARPFITGRASVRHASATYGDFPVGLSNVNGDFVFDKSRLLFDHVTAEAGGGQLALSGNVAYGEGPLRYEITTTTSSTVRIRYPEGMSWLASGTIQLAGTSTAGLISGRVQVQRLLFSQGVDIASFFAAASESSPGPPSTSPLLQNLAFDVQGQTTPGARIEWSGAHVEIDGNVRLRGTFDRPVLLGNIHLLNGEMPFRGNKFEITRGDISFSNPFRLDPELDVEATSTISEYQVTIDFSGKASHLSLNYRSDPPLPDSDIVALLALGSPGQESALRSAPGTSENYGATALLSEAISSGIGGRIEHLFGISSFRVDPFVAGTATESNAAARVTIQQQLAHGLTITYSTNAATSNQYQLIQVEYAISRTTSVIFLRDINDTYGLDVKFVKHFK